MNAGTLHDAIADVCPIESVTVGDKNDRLTWAYVPSAGATPAQIAAADNVVATIPLEPLGAIAPTDFIARFTNAEYLALEKKRRDDFVANKVGNAKNWDIVITDTVVDMNKKKVQSLKTDLVASGVLTQARADEIFS